MNVYFEADYFSRFQCKCGACRHTCCGGWQIDISREEYFCLIGMDCSPRLHRSIEGAMALPEYPTPESYRVLSPDWLGHCPMQDEDGLCLLQKERGESSLPAVCRLYPRSRRQTGSFCHACCSGSCEAVIELLAAEPVLSFRVVEDEETPALIDKADAEYPSVSLSCIAAMQNRTYPVAERLTHIAQRLGCGADNLPASEVLDAMLPSLLELSPSLRDALASRTAPPCPISDTLLENVLCNHLLYMSFPYVDDRLSKADAMPGLLMTARLLELAGNDIDTVALVFHLCEHTALYYNVKVLQSRAKP